MWISMDTLRPLGELLVAWMLTYALHSSLLVLMASVTTWWLRRRHLSVQETAWKLALLGGLVTASLQIGLGITPLTGSWALDVDSPAAELAVPAAEVHQSGASHLIPRLRLSLHRQTQLPPSPRQQRRPLPQPTKPVDVDRGCQRHLAGSRTRPLPASRSFLSATRLQVARPHRDLQRTAATGARQAPRRNLPTVPHDHHSSPTDSDRQRGHQARDLSTPACALTTSLPSNRRHCWPTRRLTCSTVTPPGLLSPASSRVCSSFNHSTGWPVDGCRRSPSSGVTTGRSSAPAGP